MSFTPKLPNDLKIISREKISFCLAAEKTLCDILKLRCKVINKVIFNESKSRKYIFLQKKIVFERLQSFDMLLFCHLKPYGLFLEKKKKWLKLQLKTKKIILCLSNMREVVLKQTLLTITCVIKKIKLLGPAQKYQNSKATKAKSCKSITKPLVLSFKLARLFPVF